jgi:cell volume regulation protein A
LVDIVSIALIISAAIILIGFLANILFERTGLPDMLILILLGAIFGPIFGVFDPEAIQSFAPFIAALALAFILFDGGMGLNIKRVLINSPRAVLLALASFIFSVLGVGLFMSVVFQLPILYGLLFGSMLGGSSSVIVVSLASKIKMNEKSSITLILESALTDILCIVVSLSFLDVIITGQAAVAPILLNIAGKFLMGGLIGLLLGFTWLFALRKVASVSFSYMLTLGIVLLGYAISEGLGGSGALSALIFGLILGNERDIRNLLKQNNRSDQPNGKVTLSVSKGLKRFEAEVAFLIRTFFFVFLGIIFTCSNIIFLIAGIGVSCILILTRIGGVWLVTLKSTLKKERGVMTVLLTRGLAAAVLATLPAQYGLAHADLFVSIAVVVIVTTAIVATIGSLIISRQRKREQNEPEPDKN